MSRSMGDLRKTVTPQTDTQPEVPANVPATPAAPLRNPVKPQGRPTRGKNKIQSRTMSMEDEYVEMIDMLGAIPRFEKFNRSDVIRAAIFELASRDPHEIEEIMRANESVSASDVSLRTEEIKRQLMGKK